MAAFDDLIKSNKRNTVFLGVAVTLVLCALASAIALVWVGFGAAPERHGGYAYDSGPPASPYGPPFMHTVLVASAAALAVALLFILFTYFGGASAILAVSGAKEIQKADDPQLFNVIEELAIATGLPKPRIFLIDDTAMNAFATGRDPQHAVVAITTGLRARLTRSELQGVMAHELAHVRNYDIRLAMFAAVMVGLVVLLADLFMRYLWWGGRGGRRGRQGGGPIMLVILIAAILLAILAPLFAKLLQLAISRQREYLADATAVETTRYPEGLASALAKLEADTEVLEAANRATAHLYIVNPFKAGEQRFKFSRLFSTHPDIQDRIQRLLSLGRAGGA